MHWEPDMGFDPGSPGPGPGPKAGAKLLRHPGIPEGTILKTSWMMTGKTLDSAGSGTQICSSAGPVGRQPHGPSSPPPTWPLGALDFGLKRLCLLC